MIVSSPSLGLCPKILNSGCFFSLEFSQNPQNLKSQINGFCRLHSNRRRLFRNITPSLSLCTQTQQPNDMPASVVNFLKEIGFSDSELKAVISWQPQLLSWDVDRILKPQVLELESNGFSKKTIINLILYNPRALKYKTILPRLRFWSNLAGNDEETLLKLIHSRFTLFNHNIDRRIVANINLLKEYGLSDKQIMLLVLRDNSYLIVRNPEDPEGVKKVMKETEEMGFEKGTGMFLQALLILCGWKKETLTRKIEIFKEIYGWSDNDVNIAFRKCPGILSLSEENIKCKMDFLIKEAGFDPKDVVLKPVLLKHSLMGKLVPRLRVLTILKEKGVKSSHSFFTACALNEERFWEKLILPYEKEVPEIGEVYNASCAGKKPPTKTDIINRGGKQVN